jgi:hypothetical protein
MGHFQDALLYMYFKSEQFQYFIINYYMLLIKLWSTSQ